METLAGDRGDLAVGRHETLLLGDDFAGFKMGVDCVRCLAECQFCNPVVRGECLEYALANGEKFGIWGGLSERERRRLRRQRAQASRGINVVNG